MNDNTPDLTADRAALDTAIIANEAATALNRVGCIYPDLFGPQVEQRLRRASDGSVDVLDEDGAIRRGISPGHLARELRDTWEKKDRGRWFR